MEAESCALLNDFGKIPLKDSVIKKAEKFIVQLYKVLIGMQPTADS